MDRSEALKVILLSAEAHCSDWGNDPRELFEAAFSLGITEEEYASVIGFIPEGR